MNGLEEVIAVALGVLLIVAIGMWIARDARRQAPVADPDHPDGLPHHRRSEQRLKRDKAKAKAARHARRANRR